jgi:acyl-CoA synthetase (AMP-forming)/AMP-acid ligase II
VIQYCRVRLASFKKPRKVVFVTNQPKAAAIKILKKNSASLRPK